VRADCKKVFFSLLEGLEHGDTRKANKVPTSHGDMGIGGVGVGGMGGVRGMGGMGSSLRVTLGVDAHTHTHETHAAHTNETHTHTHETLRCVVVEGTVGTGKSSVGRWLVQKVRHHTLYIYKHITYNI
jgi:hypothetical protein